MRYSSGMQLLSPLEKSITQLDTNYQLIQSDIAGTNPTVKAAFRTATIQSFEYAYELAMRAIKRRLEAIAPSAEEIEALAFKPLLRTAAEKGLVDDPVAWFLYREKRNITAHTYDETKALDVLSAIPEFLVSARFVLDALAAHDHASA